MKRIFSAVCILCMTAFLLSLCSACAREEPTCFTGMPTAFCRNGTASYHGIEYTFSLIRTARSIASLRIGRTALLGEIEIERNGEEMTVRYDGITQTAPVSDFPPGGMAILLLETLDRADACREAEFDAEKNAYRIRTDGAQGSATVWVDADTLCPLSFEMPQQELSVTFCAVATDPADT